MIARETYTVVVALLVAMAAGSVLILSFGESPAHVYSRLIGNTWGDLHGFGQVLYKTTPLVFTGLAVSLAFRAGLFNIGGEGQMMLGAFSTALVAAHLPAATPFFIALPLAIAAGVLAGAFLGAIPGVLKAYTGAHEVINTIMLNFIAGALILWAGNSGFFIEETTHTKEIVDGAILPKLGMAGSAANWSTFLALGVALAAWYFLARTRKGYELKAVGKNPLAAENGAINIKNTIIFSMTLSGAIAGLVGANFVLGHKHYFEEGIGSGMGFMGIAVALLGRNHPIGIIFAALLFGTLSEGGLAVNDLVPKEIVEVLQAVIILSVAAAAARFGRKT